MAMLRGYSGCVDDLEDFADVQMGGMDFADMRIGLRLGRYGLRRCADWTSPWAVWTSPMFGWAVWTSPMCGLDFALGGLDFALMRIGLRLGQK